MTVENFVRIVWTVFEKIEKSRKTTVFGHFWANFGYVSHIQDGCTSSQDRPVDGCEKLLTMTDVLKVFPWFTVCVQFWITLYHHCDPLQNLQLKVMELLETVLCHLRVG